MKRIIIERAYTPKFTEKQRAKLVGEARTLVPVLKQIHPPAARVMSDLIFLTTSTEAERRSRAASDHAIKRYAAVYAKVEQLWDIYESEYKPVGKSKAECIDAEYGTVGLKYEVARDWLYKKQRPTFRKP